VRDRSGRPFATACLLVAGLLATGCQPAGQTGGHVAAPATPAPTTSTATPSPTVSSTEATAKGSGFRVARRRVFAVRGKELGRVTLVPGGVAYTVHAATGGQSLVLLDVTTRSTRVIDTTPPGGLYEGVAAGGHWLTWVEQTRWAGDGPSPVDWWLGSYDLRTGRTRTVARSARPNPQPPVPVAAGNRVAWAVYRVTSQQADIWTADLATGSSAVVVRGVRSLQVAFDGSTLVYTVDEKDKDRGNHVANLHAVSADGRHPVQLTTNGTAGLPRLARGLLVWEDGSTGVVLARQLPQGPVTTITNTSQCCAVPGAGFVADLQSLTATDGDNVEVVPTENPSGAIELPIPVGFGYCVPCGINVRGTQLAWAVDAEDGDGRSRIVISDVQVLPRP
jgi:hypothetical protein